MFTVSLDFGSGWEDISDRLAGRRPVERTRAIHADGDPSKPVVSTARFKVARDSTLSNRFIAASASVAVKIEKDSADFFTGTVRDNHKVRVGLMSVEYFEVECVDAWMRLEKKCPLGETWADYAISDPTAKASSILHQLFYAAGFADAELDLAAIAVARDRAVFDASKGRTYRDIIEGILRETGYSAYVDASGIVHLYDLGPESIASVATLASGAGGNIAGGYEVERKEAKDEAVDVTFWPHKTLADQVLFEDTTNGSGGILACNIVLASGEYYPEGADATHDVRAEFKVKDYELVAVDSPTLDLVKTSGIDLQIGSAGSVEGLAMGLRLHASAPGSITKLRITGQAIVKGDATTKIRENVASSDKREEISCDWITTDAAADRLGIIRADWHRYSAFDYIFPECTLLTLSPGDYVTFADALLLGATQTLRVVTVSDGASEKSIKLTCEGCSAYDYAVLPYTVTSGNPPPASPAPPGTATIADLTDLQTQLGIAPGDTPAPPAPPVLSGSAYGRALVLEWTRPASSDIRLAYDMQISRDAAAWYGLGTVDGWHGTLDDISDVGTVASRVFPSLALAEESGEPVATAYSFRVRARSGSSLSGWSNVLALTIGPWSAGDIAEGAIERIKLEAQFLDETETTFRETFPNGIDAPSLPAITRLETIDLTGILDIINQETVSRDDAYIIADQKILLIAEDVSGAVSQVSTLLVTVGEIEASVAEYEGDRTRIGEIEVKADSVTATVADYDGEKAKIAQLQIDLDAITTIVGELPTLGEVGNLSIITQSATKIDQVISEFGSVVDGTFVPLGAYSDVVQTVDRFEAFVHGTGTDADEAAWIVRPEDISAFMIADDVDAMVDAALDPKLADYVTVSTFEETASGFDLTVGSYKTEADRASIRDREDFIAWLDDAEMVRGSQFIMTDTMIALVVTAQDETNASLQASITVEADRITSEVSRAVAGEVVLASAIVQEAGKINLAVFGTESIPSGFAGGINNLKAYTDSQFVVQDGMLAAQIKGKVYDPVIADWIENESDARFALSLTVPQVLSSAKYVEIRAAITARQGGVPAALDAVFTSAAYGGETRYYLKSTATPEQLKACRTEMIAVGKLASQFAVEADEIILDGTVYGRHMNLDSAFIASLEALSVDAKFLSAGSIDAGQIDATGLAIGPHQVEGLETALENLDDISSDSKLTPVEKKAVLAEWNVIYAEKSANIAQGTAFGVSTAAYSAAFDALADYLDAGNGCVTGLPEWIKVANMGTTTDIDGTTYRAKWQGYYSSRTTLLNAIAAKAKSVADGAASAAEVEIAVQLGYESYSDMVSKVAANGHTYINGGLINTDLIKVGENTLVADGFISTSCLKAASIDIGKLSNLTPANIGAVTTDTVPRYLGAVRYGLAWALTANAGDWILVLATAEHADFRGIHIYQTAGAKDEYSARTKVDTSLHPSYLTSSAISDLLAWTTPAVKEYIDYGLPVDYGTSFIANFVASSAFIADLTASEAFIADLSVKHVAVDGDIEAHAMNAAAIATKSTTSTTTFNILYPCTAKLYMTDGGDTAMATITLYGTSFASVSASESEGVMLNPGSYTLTRANSGTARLDFHGMFGASDAAKLFGT